MKTKSSILLIMMAMTLLSLFPLGAWAKRAQTLNPLYVEARDLWQQLRAINRMPANKKATYGQRFGALSKEQQALWSLAKQVDSRACKDQCLSSYNARVESWQSKLTVFNSEVHAIITSLNQTVAGKWVTIGKFTQLNVACHQTWACVPKEGNIHAPDTRIVSTPRQTITGMCQITSNPKSCGSCTATLTPPKDSCEWHLEYI